jgi:hypothetical protein
VHGGYALAFHPWRQPTNRRRRLARADYLIFIRKTGIRGIENIFSQFVALC